MGWLEEVGQDLGYAIRQLFKAPGFAVTVVLTLALGIGACTVVFTAINTTLLHPAEGPDPGLNVVIYETLLPQRPQISLSIPDFLDIKRQAKSFESVAVWARQTVQLRGATEPYELTAMLITPRATDFWGLPPFLGRLFGEADYATDAPHVVVLGYSLWQRAFGGDQSIIGRSINLNDSECTVVGVMSPRFARFGSEIELFAPFIFTEQQRTAQRGARFLQAHGRLKPGVTLEQAQAELDIIAANMARQYPDTNRGVGLRVRDFGVYINRSMRPMLYTLLGAVSCVLLIACANVANLLLARATVRQREMSIRAALGAGRGRIMRQLLVESILFAALGGGAGILLASWGLRFIRIYGPSAGTDMARLAYVELEPGVLCFTLGFSLLTGLIFGLAPAWLSSHVDLNEALKQGSRGSTDSRGQGGLRSILVMIEVALALVLLTGAGLLVKSFAQLSRVDLGYGVDRVATMRVMLNGRKYARPEERLRFADELLRRIQALPGVESVGLVSGLPTGGSGFIPFSIVGRPPPTARNQPGASPNLVTHEYFQAMKVRLVRGRFFNAQDGLSGPAVFVINESLARQYFPVENPLGRQLTLKPGGTLPDITGEIVGVAGDVAQGEPGAPRLPQFYLPWAQLRSGGFYVVAHTTGDPTATLGLLKSQVFAVDKDQPVGAVRTMEDLLNETLARPRLMLKLLGAFGLIALLIAAVGIYGVMAYTVNQRTSEFGIRMALGASHADVLRQVLRRGMANVSLGLIVGLVAALGLGQVVQSLLYDTSPRDPLTFAAIIALLLLVSFIACLLPAWRATKVDPIVALRAE